MEGLQKGWADEKAEAPQISGMAQFHRDCFALIWPPIGAQTEREIEAEELTLP